MTDYRRLFWLLSLSAFLLMATGCTTSRWVSVNEELDREDSGLHKESGQAISGYRLNDDTEAEYMGKVRFAAQDSLVFWSKEYVAGHYESGKWVPKSRNPVPDHRFALNAVKALKVDKNAPAETILLVIVVTAIIVGTVAIREAMEALGDDWN